jgi:hypothetical protein
MKNFKHILTWTPEVYFILSIIYYWVLTGTIINQVAISFLALLILQITIRNKISGIIIATIFILLNIYMYFTLLSEFYEFPIIDTDAKRLLIVGSIYLGLNLVMAVLMLIKYIKINFSALQVTT